MFLYCVRCQVQQTLTSHPSVLKLLCEGRVVVLYLSRWQYCLALILGKDSRSQLKPVLNVLILCEEGCDESLVQTLIADSVREMGVVHSFIPFKKLNIPEPPIKHAVVGVPLELIHSITSYEIQADFGTIIKDYNKRQIPRFRLVKYFKSPLNGSESVCMCVCACV